MLLDKNYDEEWRIEKNAKSKVRIAGYPDQPNVAIGEYMAIDHKRVQQISNGQTDNTGSCASN